MLAFGNPLWCSKTHCRCTLTSSSVSVLGYFNNLWCIQWWPPEQADSDILLNMMFLELFPIVVVICRWQDVFRDHRVLFWRDNQAMVQVINGKISCSEQVMWLVRKLVLTCLVTNICFSVKYIPGTNNGIADDLSQFQEERFRQLAPKAHP